MFVPQQRTKVQEDQDPLGAPRSGQGLPLAETGASAQRGRVPADRSRPRHAPPCVQGDVLRLWSFERRLRRASGGPTAAAQRRVLRQGVGDLQRSGRVQRRRHRPGGVQGGFRRLEVDFSDDKAEEPPDMDGARGDSRVLFNEFCSTRRSTRFLLPSWLRWTTTTSTRRPPSRRARWARRFAGIRRDCRRMRRLFAAPRASRS